MHSVDNKKKRVCGYIRVSTGIQAKEGESLDTQTEQIQNYCKSHEWELVKIYEDAGISGGKAEKRPAFMEMIRGAKVGEFELVVFTKLSWFARNARDYYNFQHELDKYDVSLVSIKENIDPTNLNGRLMAGIFALLAEWEREMIREQMYENKMAKWRDKRIFNGRPPLGYLWDKKKCEFKENAQETKVLKLVFDSYVKLGFSMLDVAEQLNKDKYKTRRKTKWSTASVSYILKNPCYSTCQLITNQTVYDDDGKPTKELKSESEWIIYELPRILPKSLCNRVDKKRAFNTSKQRRTTWQQDHWLRDSLFCGHCGGRMRAEKGDFRKDGSFLRKYVCGWSCCGQRELQLAGRTKCPQGKISAQELEHYIWDQLSFSLTGSHPDAVKERDLQREAEEQFSFLGGGNIEERIEDIEDKIQRLKNEYQKKRRANTRILDLLEDEETDIKSLGARLQENEQTITTLSEEIGNSENDRLELQQLLEDKSNFLNSREKLFSIWSDLRDFSPEDKKRMIESLVPDGITVKIPRSKIKRMGPENVSMEVVWNPLIFQHFEEQGKFVSLDSDGCYQL